MKLNIARVIIICVSTVYLSCQSTTFSGGGGVEGEGRICASVVYSDGTVASGVRVRLIDKRGWWDRIQDNVNVAIDSTLTDSAGVFLFENLTATEYNLEILGMFEGLLVPDFRQTGDGAVPVLSLGRYATIAGTIAHEKMEPDTVLMYGTSFRALVGDDNTFFLDKIPEGKYYVLAKYAVGSVKRIAGAGVISVLQGQSLSGLTLLPQPGTLLIDDFSNAQPFLGMINGGGWYTFIDQDTTCCYSTMHMEYGGIGSPDQTLRCTVVLGYREFPYAGFGYIIDPACNSDFSTLEKVTFRARGSGSVRISIEGALIDSRYEEGESQFGTFIQLDSSWVWYDIPADSLKLPDYSAPFRDGYQWKDVTTSICRIEFEVSVSCNSHGDTVRIELDDLMVHGVLLEDILR